MVDEEEMKLFDIRSGDTLRALNGFTCLKDGDVRKVHANKHGQLFVRCTEGNHYLDGQVDRAGDVEGFVKVSNSDV